MKRSVAVIGMVLALSGAGFADGIKLGDAAPLTGVKMKNVDGKDVAIADVKGAKGTLVIFSCNHCPFVKGWEKRIAALGNSYRQKGIGVIQINANDPAPYPEDDLAGMQQRTKDRGFEFPYVVDAGSKVAQAFGATRTPEVFLFDTAGKLVYHGTVDDNYQNADAVNEHYLNDALNALLAGKEIAVKETKAVGCSIKFYKKS
jgi:peroxiredoxin